MELRDRRRRRGGHGRDGRARGRAGGRRGGAATAAAIASIAAPRSTGPIAINAGRRRRSTAASAPSAHDLVHGVLHLDGKFWRTLPLLAWRPGELTRRYVDGERAKFVSPMAMFLFSVFLMFAVLSICGVSLASLDVTTGGGRARLGLEAARAEVAHDLAEARERSRRAALAARECGSTAGRGPPPSSTGGSPTSRSRARGSSGSSAG